ncbi:MAG TPA: PKD domain-containing protein, partial [Thermoanaerobaculia bacterium]|nr:PKD domain-containing protein [Thermoanaerobaculia bacterium]
PPPAPAGTRDVALSSAGETPGDFATLRNLALSGKAATVTVPPGTYGRFSATARTVLVLGTAGSTAAAIYNLERLDLSGGAELRVAGPTVINLRDGATVTGASAGAIDAPGQLILNVSGGDVQVLGTGVLAALVRIPAGLVSIDGNGVLRGTVGADRLQVSGNGVLQVTQNDVPPPQVNRPPSVSAGADQTITLPDNSVRLEGVVADDGLPKGSAVAISWSVVEGGAVSFSDATSAITTATFQTPGTYVLRLSANDSALRTTDDITITVLPENQPPQVEAGADQRIELPAKAALSGTATDDGLPAGSTLKTTWSRVAGPGTVTFTDSAKLATQAAFSAAGVYTLRLTATDGEDTIADELTVTVDPENKAPVVSAGDDQFIVLPNGATLSGTASDDGWPHGSTLVTQWTKVSGAGAVTFANAAKTATTATFASAGVYVLRLSATDGRDTRTDDVTITVDPVNAGPVVSAGANATIELPNVATLNGTVTDDGWPRGSKVTQQWSVVSGSGVTFADASAVSTTATFAAAGVYTLRLTATDGVESASADVTITVHPANQAPIVDAGADATLRLPATAALIGEASDDGWPHGSTLTTTWSRVSGPGTVAFGNASALATSASFSAAGTYVLRLSATDSRATTHDDVTIVVLPANEPPKVNAGVDATASAGANLLRNGGAEVLRNDGTLDGWTSVSGNFTRAQNGGAEGGAFFKAGAAGEVSQTVDVTAIPQGTQFELRAFVRGAARATFEFVGSTGTLLDSFDADAQPSAGWSSVTETRAGPAGTASIRVRLIATGEAAFDAISVRAPGVASATLPGSVLDDGLPAGSTLEISWTSVSGPAAVVFGDATRASTTAAFSKPGTYVLRLSANDGEGSVSDDVTIVVSAANQPPIADAGAAQSVRLPAKATLAGHASDDGLPANSALDISWSAVAGGDAVTISGASSETPTITFAAAGTYVLRLTVSDSEFTVHDDVTVVVAAANHPPVVSAGTDATITLPNVATLAGSASDEDGTTLTLQWSVVSGGAVTFANAASATTTATFAAAGTYVLRLTANDGELSTSDDVTITVRPEPINQAPVVDAGPPQSAGTREQVELSGTATDDGLPATGALAVTWSVISGPGQVTFANAKAAATTATFSAAGVYALQLTATDSLLTSSAQTIVTVTEVPVAAFTTPGTARFATEWNNNVASIYEGASIASFSSSNGTTVSADKAIDDSHDTRWTSAAGQPSNQFIVVDLAGNDPHTVDRVRVVNASSSEGVRTFRIDVSSTTADPSAFNTVAEGSLSDGDRVQEVVFAAVPAKYVRFVALTSRSTSTVSIRSLEVIAPSRSGILTYLSPATVGKAAEGGSVVTTSSGAGSYAIDDTLSTVWQTLRSTTSPGTVEISLPQTYRIDAIRLVNSGTTRSVKTFRVTVSVGPTVPAVYTTVLEGTAANNQDVQVFTFPGGPVDARLVRVTLLTNYGDSSYVELRELDFVTAPGSHPSASSYRTDSRPEMLLDGSVHTYWMTPEGRIANQFAIVKVTDDEPHLIDGVTLSSHNTLGVKDFDVLVSTTTQAPGDFRRVLSGTVAGDTKQYFFPFEGGPVRARFVKLVPKTNYGATYVAVGTFLPRTIDGQGNLISAPLPPPAVRHLSPVMVANGATATASSGTPQLMLDYVHSATWTTTNKTAQWAKIDLAGDEPHQISGVVVAPRLDGTTMPGEGPKDFEVWVSSTTSDDAAFTKVLSAAVTVNGLNRFTFPTVAAKYIKYVPLTSQGASSNIGTGYFDVIHNAGGVIATSSNRSQNVGPGAFDGNTATYWFTATGANESLTFALAGLNSQKVYGVYIDPYGGDGPRDFEIRVSNTTADASAFTTVYSGTTPDISARNYYFGRTADAKYVQFFWKSSRGNAGMVAVRELNILTIVPEGAALIGLSSVSSFAPPTNVLDANPRNTEWNSATNATTNQFITVTMPGARPYVVDHVALQGHPSCCPEYLPRDFDIQVSMEDATESSFRTVYSGTMRKDPANMQHFFFPATQARHVRVLLRNNWGGPQVWVRTFWVFSPQVGSTTARFLDASSATDSIVSWDWSFGDGGRSSERDPLHQYAAPGLYDVSLTVRDARGRSSTYTLPYRADGGPVADFTFAPNPGKEATHVQFVDASSSNLGALTNHRWSWGDNTPDHLDEATINHAFDDNGTYSVTHTVTNATGISTSVTKPVTITNVPPTGNAGPDLRVQLGDDWGAKPAYSDVSEADRKTLLCRWDFGDGQTFDHVNCYATPVVRHAYALPGVYDAKLTVLDKDGASIVDTLKVTVTKRATHIRYSGDRDFMPGEPIALAASVVDSSTAKAIAGMTVQFQVGEQLVSAVSDANGVATASLIYAGLSDGAKVTVTFAGDTLYEPSSYTFNANCAANPKPLDIAMVFDVSGSFVNPLPQVKVAAREFLTTLSPVHQVSIVSFADTDVVEQQLTTDRALAAAAIDRLAIRGGTNINTGIDGGRRELISARKNPNAKPVLILLSDGEDFAGQNTINAANAAKAAGIRLVSVIFGNSSPVYTDLMKSLASTPQDFWLAEKSDALKPVYASIVDSICTASNRPPYIALDPTRTLLLPENTIALDATVSDDGLPEGKSVTTTWTATSGPGTVTFANANAVDTTATFSAEGVYVLTLTANDTELSRIAQVTVTVAMNKAPVVNAGADRNVALPPGSTSLSGTVTDDGLPGAALTHTWSVTSGPGSVTFANANALNTTATFTAPGTYVLTLTASDSLLTTSDQVTLTTVVNQPPTVSAGPDQQAAFEANLLVNGGNDEPLVNGAIRGWTPVSGTWSRPATGTNGLPLALRGDSYFFAGNDATAELQQDVDVSALAPRIDAGQQQFAWSAFARGAAEAIPDAADVVVEYRNAANTTVLGGHGVELTGADWQKGEQTNLAPAGTRWIRVRLKVTRRSGATTDVVIDAVTLRALNAAQARLAGNGSDDGVPAPLQTTWSGTGPGAVVFSDPASATSSVVVDKTGDYTLRLTATDTVTTVTDDVLLSVAARNVAPAVDAGPDAEIRLPSTATLSAIVNDDGRPAALTLRWELVSGPEAVTFSNAAAASTVVTFTKGGSYRFRVIADDSDELRFDTVTINVLSAAGNAAPTVNAGSDVVIAPPNTTATLNATVTDDGLPTGNTLTTTWSQASGPGTATFSDASSRTPTVTFSNYGVYALRLTATDGELSTSDEVTVRYDGTNQPPTVNAGADRSVKLNAATTLTATITDDNLPLGATLSLTWTKVSGPGTVTFTSNTSATTNATFSAIGTYVLKLTATDSALNASDEVTITVEEALPAPTVEITSPESGSTITDRTVFTGTVSEGANWRLEYRLNGNDAAAATNPWTVISSGSGPVNGALGTFDPTLLLNGTYKIRLAATNSAGVSEAVSVSSVVEGDLKVGAFSLSFTDLEVPLPGVPLVIARTYDSRDKRIGDFGVGWTMQLRNVRLEKSGLLGTGWVQNSSGGSFPQYCIQAAIPRYVTITFASNKVYKFQMATTPRCQQIVPIKTPDVIFTPVGDTRGSLVPEGDSTVIVQGSIPGEVTLFGDGAAEAYNPSMFRLTLDDGTVLVISETEGVKSITDANGNRITFTRDGILHSAGRSVTFARDTAGRITQITDLEGKKHAYTYDTNGDLVTVTDPTARATSFTYNSRHDVLEYYDSAGRRGVKNEYDAAGRLIRTTDSNGRTIEAIFDPTTRREVVTDRRGNSLVYEYNALGRIVGVFDGTKSTRATYDLAGKLLTKTDWLGRTSTFEYDARENLKSEKSADGKTTTYTYDAANRLSSVTDANSRTTSYTYDALGNVSAITDALNRTVRYTYTDGQIATITDAEGNKTQYGRDDAGNITAITDQDGNITRMTYDSMGRRLSVTDPRGAVYAYTYDAAGRPLTATTPSGTLSREYDEAGNVKKTVDEHGQLTETTSTTTNQPSSAKFPDGSAWSLEYDENDALLRSVRTGMLPSLYERNAAGDITQLKIGERVIEQYDVDAVGRRTSVTDARGGVSSLAYDGQNRITATTNALQHTVAFEYDAGGNRTAITDRNGNKTSYTYDAGDRVASVVNPDGTTTEYGWNSDDQPTLIKKPSGASRQFTYTPAGLLSTVTEPGGAVTKYEYDANGNLVGTEDANQRRMSLEYEAHNRLAKRIHADGKTETYTYSGVWPASKTDRAGRTTTLDYDVFGRLLKAKYADGDFVGYTYTSTGKPDLVSSSTGVVDYDYDAFGNVSRVRHADGSVVTYEYDEARNRTAVTTVDGTTRYEYDAVNRLAAVTDPHGHVTKYAYDPNGNVIRTEYPNGLITARTYDEMDRVATVETRGRDGQIIFGERHEYDADGNRDEIAYHDGSRTSYSYDELARVTGELYTAADGSVSRRVTYSYDAVGNRLTATDTARPTALTYTYSAVDELTSDGTRAYAYDAAGNVRTVTTTDGTVTTYGYDAQNRLTTVALPAGGSLQYAYDAAGSRVGVADSAGGHNFVFDMKMPVPQPLREYDAASGKAVASYVHGNGVVSSTHGDTELVYVTDGMGSVRALVDLDGRVTDTYSYTAFGEIREQTGTTANPFRYRGDFYDQQTGLYYLRTRYYNPATGRFLTMDSLPGVQQDPQSRNRYAYAANKPVNNVDHCGRCAASSQPGQLKLGNAADDIIGAYYTAEMAAMSQPCYEVWIDTWLPPAPDLKKFGYRVGKKRGGLGCRPDMVEFCTGEVFEVKSLSAEHIARAPMEAAGYAFALNMATAGDYNFLFQPGTVTFRDPSPIQVGGLIVHGPNFHGLPGAVFYADDW